MALLGPSGCGKSTVLRSIAGLIQPHAGEIALGEKRLDRLPARSRGIGMVFQNYALFPHLTVAENIAYPLACQHIPKPKRKTRVAELLALVRLDTMAKRLPRELSGGQQQRVAVARALAARPSLLLLDEPFGALDRALRFDLQVEMLRLQRSLGITTLIVTHDQEEAQSLASQLVLMNRGRIEQIDTPTGVYDRPKTLFVNSFIGQANQLRATVTEVAEGRSSLRLTLGQTVVIPRRLDFIAGSQVVITCRPEDLAVVSEAGDDRLAAQVSVAIALGPSLVHELTLAGGAEMRVSQMRGPDTRAGMSGERVSWTGFGSNTAVMAYTQLARIYGSGPGDMDAVFKLFTDHPDNLKGVVDSTNSQMTLYQQGEIAVFMCSTGNVAKLRSLGLNAEFVHPESGSPAAPVNVHLTKGSANVDAAYAYMDAAISAAAQTALMDPPTQMFPTNADVALTPAIEQYVSRATIPNLVYPDWALINQHRQDWIRAFDALVAN